MKTLRLTRLALAALLMTLTLASCGDDDDDNELSPSTQTENEEDEEEAGEAEFSWNSYVKISGIVYQVSSSSTTAPIISADDTLSGAVIIPQTITYNKQTFTVSAIESYAFSNTPVSSVSLPATITTLGDECFSGCTLLSQVTCQWHSLSTLTVGTNIFQGIPTTSVLYVPKGTSSLYASKAPWSSFTTIVEMDE